MAMAASDALAYDSLHGDGGLESPPPPSGDDVERAIAALEDTVKACKWQPPGGVHERYVRRDEAAFARPAQPPPEVVTEQPAEQRPTDPPELTPIDPEDERERAMLCDEILKLRSDLQNSNARFQAASEQAASASTAARGAREKHKQWAKGTEAEVLRLRDENKRLERSLRQAGIEERRSAELVRAAPGQAEASLLKARTEYQRLDKENQQMQVEIGNIRAELSTVRDVVECKRGGVGGASGGSVAGATRGSSRNGGAASRSLRTAAQNNS